MDLLESQLEFFKDLVGNLNEDVIDITDLIEFKKVKVDRVVKLTYRKEDGIKHFEVNINDKDTIRYIDVRYFDMDIKGELVTSVYTYTYESPKNILNAIISSIKSIDSFRKL